MIWLMAAQLATAAIGTETPPVLGVETIVRLADGDHPKPGETVRVVHRPGLHGEVEIAVGITDSRGRVRWTPDRGGVAELRAGPHVQRIVVEAPAPLGAQVLLGTLVVGSVLGAAIGVRRRRWGRS